MSASLSHQKNGSSSSVILSFIKSKPCLVRRESNTDVHRSQLSAVKHVKITAVDCFPQNPGIKLMCKQINFKSREIQLEAGTVTTINNHLAYNRTVFADQKINLFNYHSALSRDMVWIVSLLKQAGVKQACIINNQFGQANLQQLLSEVGISVLTTTNLSNNDDMIWKSQKSKDHWNYESSLNISDLSLPSTPVTLNF